jgi:hypothetical protein
MGQRRRPLEEIRRINYEQLCRDVDQLTERVRAPEHAQQRLQPRSPKSYEAPPGCELSRSRGQALSVCSARRTRRSPCRPRGGRNLLLPLAART